MVGSVNKVILLGNLGRDPEIRSLQTGNKMAAFSLATSKRWKDKTTQEQKDKTSWHNVVIFGEGLVDIVEKYVKKGSKIFVEGELQTRKWQDKDGNDRYTTEVVLQGYNSTLTLLDSRSSVKSDIIEENSNQILDFTKEVKVMDEEKKIEIIETLWRIIYSNKDADIYETNLMRRLAGLMYIDNKIMGSIQEKIKKEQRGSTHKIKRINSWYDLPFGRVLFSN